MNLTPIIMLKNYVVVAAVAALALTACSKKERTSTSEQPEAETAGLTINYMPVQQHDEGLWNMMAPDGTLLFDTELDGTPSMAINGYFNLTDPDGKFVTVYKAAAEPEVLGNLDNLHAAGLVSEGLIPVVADNNSRIEYYHEDGSPAFALDPINGVEFYSVSSYFSEGYAWAALEDGTTCTIDRTGRVIIAPGKYSMIGDFVNGLSVASYSSGEDLEEDDVESSDFDCVIDVNGNKLFDLGPGVSSPTRQFSSDGILIVNSLGIGQSGYFDRQGNYTSFPANVYSVTNYYDGKVIFDNADYEVGVMTLDGTVIIEPIYSSVYFLPNGTYLVTKKTNNRWSTFIIDGNGNELKSFKSRQNVYTYFASNLNTDFDAFTQNPGNIYKYNGKYVNDNLTDFAEVGMNYPTYVISTYFDPERYGRELAARVADNKLNGVGIGDYCEDIDGFAQDYNVEDYGVLNTSLAYACDVYGASENLNYIPLNPPTVVFATTYLNFPDDAYFARAKNAAVKQLQSVGYELMGQTPAWSVLRLPDDADTYVLVMPRYWEYEPNYQLSISILPKTLWFDSGLGDSFLAKAERIYNEIAGKQDNPPRVREIPLTFDGYTSSIDEEIESLFEEGEIDESDLDDLDEFDYVDDFEDYE